MVLLYLWISSTTTTAPLLPLPPPRRHHHARTRSEAERSLDEEIFLRARCEEDSEDEAGDADPVQDDLYVRRVEQTLHQTSANPDFDKFLPKYWTPEEEVHVRRIKLGSQRRPWYRKMQGFRFVPGECLSEIFRFGCQKKQKTSKAGSDP